MGVVADVVVVGFVVSDVVVIGFVGVGVAVGVGFVVAGVVTGFVGASGFVASVEVGSVCAPPFFEM